MVCGSNDAGCTHVAAAHQLLISLRAQNVGRLFRGDLKNNQDIQNCGGNC
jgi:hypothetical protein